MCLTHLVQVTHPSLLLYLDAQYLDSRILEKAESSAKVINLFNALQINGSQLKPDAIVLRAFDNQIKVQKTYTVSSNNWNDYGYLTTITGIDDVEEAKVGYIGQQSNDHTTKKLQELYQKNEWGALSIDARLPNNFYSFWGISDQFDSNYLHKMCYFNHLFYLGLEKHITDWNQFLEEILQPLGVIFGLRSNDSRRNVFTHSLLRYYSVENIEKNFNNFIQQTLSQYEEFFDIIDIKYLTDEYFCDRNKIEDIKRRSVRKQFVYEHLLQRALERKNDRFSNLSLRSSFWLPSYRPNDSDWLEEGATFMDGYIQLKNVNFMVLAESYLA